MLAWNSIPRLEMAEDSTMATGRSVPSDPTSIEAQETRTSTIDTQGSPSSNPASTSEHPAGWIKQLLWYRHVRQPWMLTTLLRQKHGKGKYWVEVSYTSRLSKTILQHADEMSQMRHNVYEIWAPSKLTTVGKPSRYEKLEAC